MASIYETMTKALQDHWKAHNNAYPQRFELTDSAYKQLVDDRKVVVRSMNYAMWPGWEKEFQGCKIAVVDAGNCIVDKDGNRLPLAL